MIQDLERHCFLTVSEDGIVSVHDVYLKFAKGIQDDPSKYISTSRSWHWKEIQSADANQSVRSWEARGTLRALVLEVGESCKRVDLQGYSGLKAVGLTDCKSLAVLGLTGLSSLRTLEIRNCASFRRLECHDSDFASLRNVGRFSFKNGSTSATEQDDQEREQLVSYYWQPMMVAKMVKRVIGPLIRQPHSLEVGAMLSQMRSLQVLNLENTGIARLECVGSMRPQLRALTVIEQLLERSSKIWRRKEGDERQGQLGSLPAGLVTLKLHHFYTATELPDLSSSAHTLQGLDVFDCEKLERVNLDTRYLKSLRTLELCACHNLVEVNGLGSPPSLRVLKVCECRKLESVKGFENSEMLEELSLCGLAELREISDFMRSLGALRELGLGSCPKLATLVAGEYDHLEKLTECRVPYNNMALAHYLCGMGSKLKTCVVSIVEYGGNCCFDLSNCKELQKFVMQYYGNHASCARANGQVKVEGVDKLEKLQELRCHQWITVVGLRSLRGVESLESLIQLRHLYVLNCSVLEEFPSLHALVHSMERLPLSNFDSLEFISFRGCKFASDVQKMAAWAMDEAACPCLRAEALCSLVELYYQLDRHINKEKQQLIVEVLWWSMVRWMPSNNDSCLDFSRLERAWVKEITWRWKASKEEEPFLKAAVQELGSCMQRGHSPHLHPLPQ
ncbi:hypothetical protein GOP47_0008500 [Adiantum capillus-veneris]|uniref:Uncharacterized protein n=1 Tax=Adiantum capillus-veneris TaxID=13818 RepID=A0A9D4ZKS4_ADICA|nr:hypothetical protein GOP47_0008500 [Adiantum capillus-veneris]